VDGRPWPLATGSVVWLPPGTHSIESAAAFPPVRLLDLNAELKSAAVTPSGVEFSYESSARVLARFDHAPRKVQIDGAEAQPAILNDVLVLPRGQHIVIAGDR
jgi:hypothetical protein